MRRIFSKDKGGGGIIWKKTLQIGIAFMFADNLSAADIPSLLLLICGCEKNISDVTAEFLTIM